MKSLLLKIFRALGRPLTLSQVLSSAAGAGVMLIAASSMEEAGFTLFSLLMLVSNTLVGLFRAAIFQPALITQRTTPGALVPLRYASLAWILGGAIMVGTAIAFDVRSPIALTLLGVTSGIPLLFDWLRFRAMAHDRRWVAAQGDLIRVVLIVVTLAVPMVRTDAITLQVYASASTLLPLIFMAIRLPRLRTWEPYRTYRRAGGWQTLDYAFGATLVALPLLILGGLGPSSTIPGVRLAQSLLGPLNLAFAASVSNMVADGATRPELAADSAVIGRGIKLGRLMAGLAIALVSTVILVVALTGFSFKGVTNSSLMLGLALIGASAITTGWSSTHAVVLRMLNMQGRVTIGRAIISVVTVAGFVIGYFVDGITMSLIIGFATLTLANPVVFISISARHYRSVTAT